MTDMLYCHLQQSINHEKTYISLSRCKVVEIHVYGFGGVAMGRSKKDMKATFHPDLHQLYNVMEHKKSINVMTCGSYLHLAIEQLTLTSESFALLM